MFVKVWTAIRRGQSAAVDLAMLAMFDAVSRLPLKPAAGLPHSVAAGLSQAGPFIVSRHVDGLPLSELDIIASVGWSDEHPSELQSLMRTPYAVCCLQQPILLDSNTTT